MASRNVKVPKVMNQDVLDMSHNKYLNMIDYNNMEKDKNGFIKLKPTSSKIDSDSAHLKTDILSLEDKLREYRKKHEKVEKLKETEEYKASKKKQSKKKQKKSKQHLLEMVFNNADGQDDEDDIEETDDENYRDNKKRGKKSGSKSTRLDTVYGQRFTPVVSMLHDSINEFGQLADEIRDDLNASKSSARTMYRSAQMGNLISAKNSQLSAIKELASVAKIVSDLEYKKDKDSRIENGNNNKAISALGAKYLRGGGLFDDDDDKKSKKNKKGKKSDSPAARKVKHDDDDDEYSEMSLEYKKNQRELAEEFAKTLTERKGDFKLTPHERFINMEGTYKFVIVADPTDIEGSWEFVAVDPKDEKKIKGFKDKYKELYPSKKKCKMVFDLGKMRVTDKTTSRTYKLILK